MKKSLFITVSICFVLVLGSASQIHAQSVAGITGLAGFETEFQVIASVDLAHQSVIGDLFPPGATIGWGDGSSETGLLSCTGGEHDPCLVLGSHWYASPNVYTVSITYNDPAGPCILLVIDCGPGAQHTLYTTATITAPWNDPEAYVIVSIGDSIASGEGNPSIPASNENYPGNQNYLGNPAYGYWDDPNADYNVLFYPPDEQQAWPNQSFPCHRASWAGPAQAGSEIQSTNPKVTFIHFACSGAKIGATDTAKDTVQDAINQLRIVRQRVPRIDALLISAGANSLSDGSDCTNTHTFGCGFGALFEYCVTSVLNPCSTNQQFQDDFTASLNKLPSEYMNLAKEINCVNPADGTAEPSCNYPQNQIPKMVLITEYMDPTHDQNGNFPAFSQCAAVPTLTQSDWQFVHDSIVQPLNAQVDSFPAYALQAGLSAPTFAVGIAKDFLTHGICAGNQRWVYDVTDSEKLLGPGEPPGLPGLVANTPLPPSTWLHGSGHPIAARYISELSLASSPCCGQEDYRDRIYNTIVQNSYAVTTESATVGGAPYTFGTWATQDVVVTLSATNPIKEAGVKQTVYGVDNPSCQPVTWPDCSTYSGPFTISTSGKRTVTASSLNNSGLLGPFQTVQVWVEKEPPVITVSGELLRPNHEEEKQKLVRIEISGKITDSLSGVAASSATYMVKDDDGVLQTGGPLTLAPNGTYRLVVSFKRTHNSEDEDRDERERDRKKYKITVSAQDNAGNQGSASTFAVREKHEDRE